VPSTRAVTLEWAGRDLKFRGEGTEPVTAEIAIDGDGETGPSPMQALLLACAGCSGADVVVILEKMRVRLTRLSIDVSGVRRDDDPKRYTSLEFRFSMSGDGLDAAKAERAVRLSLDKYCSVVHSLAPDITVGHRIDLV